MSSYLRGSANYVWSTTSILGKGATATVHQGVNKTTGEQVAVKTFNHMSTLRPHEVQIREFEVLKKVNHENIVKLLAIEEEQENRGNVIVMELCTGGSLFNILDDPENTYGLEESEFLLVLRHLFSGIKHLRDNNLVHRDLKPGNIMKFIKDDGTTVYKLTDFGAARELHEGEHFQSLYGTEEYLHPDMYERAVLRKSVNKTFDATIDLWSIGVTLYHVATGNLPFRPCGGRRNKETMHLITTTKKSGVISGIQMKENGPIEYRHELPFNCQLSVGLKKIITPLLAGLLEVDRRKIWSFDMFFKQVEAVLARKAINIFHVNEAQLIKVFIHPNEKYTELQEYIKEQTSIKPESQILLYKDSLFTRLLEDYFTASAYPDTQEEKPLFLFNRENNNISPLSNPELPKFNDFSNVISVEVDASQAKIACSIGHQAKRQIQKFSLASKLICDTVEYFSRYVRKELQELNKTSQHLLDKTAIFKKTAEIFQTSQNISNYSLKTNYVDKLDSVSSEFTSTIAPSVQNLYKQHGEENDLQLQWESSARELKCPFKTLAPARAKTQVEHLRDSWQHLVRDRATRTLSYNDEQFHVLERIKIPQTLNKLRDLLDKEVYPQYEQLAENFGDWYKMAQSAHLKMEILVSDVQKYETKLNDYDEKLSIANMDYSNYVKKLSQKSRNSLPMNNQNAKNGVIKSWIRDYKQESKEINDVLLENGELLKKLTRCIDDFK